jgi:hypothetical protein
LFGSEGDDRLWSFATEEIIKNTQIANVATDGVAETTDRVADGKAEFVDKPADNEVADEVGPVFGREDDEKIVLIGLELAAAENSGLTSELRVKAAVREGRAAKLEEVEICVGQFGIWALRKVEDHRNPFFGRNTSPKVGGLTDRDAGNCARDERGPRNSRIDLHQPP